MRQAPGDGRPGNLLHDRHRDGAGRRHRGGGRRRSLRATGTPARPGGVRRRPRPLRAASRMGKRDVPPAARRRVRRPARTRSRLRAGGRARRRPRSTAPWSLRTRSASAPRSPFGRSSGRRRSISKRASRPRTGRSPSCGQRRRTRRTSRRGSLRSSSVARRSSGGGDRGNDGPRPVDPPDAVRPRRCGTTPLRLTVATAIEAEGVPAPRRDRTGIKMASY